MSTTESPEPEPEGQAEAEPYTDPTGAPGFSTERSAELTTQQGAEISHAEQTAVEWPAEAEEPEAEAAHPEKTPEEE